MFSVPLCTYYILPKHKIITKCLIAKHPNRKLFFSKHELLQIRTNLFFVHKNKKKKKKKKKRNEKKNEKQTYGVICKRRRELTMTMIWYEQRNNARGINLSSSTLNGVKYDWPQNHDRDCHEKWNTGWIYYDLQLVLCTRTATSSIEQNNKRVLN